MGPARKLKYIAGIFVAVIGIVGVFFTMKSYWESKSLVTREEQASADARQERRAESVHARLDAMEANLVRLVLAVSEAKKPSLESAFKNGYITFGATMSGESAVFIKGKMSDEIDVQWEHVRISQLTPDSVVVKFPYLKITIPNKDSNLPSFQPPPFLENEFGWPRRENATYSFLGLPNGFSLQGKLLSNGDPVVVAMGLVKN